MLDFLMFPERPKACLDGGGDLAHKLLLACKYDALGLGLVVRPVTSPFFAYNLGLAVVRAIRHQVLFQKQWCLHGGRQRCRHVPYSRQTALRVQYRAKH